MRLSKGLPAPDQGNLHILDYYLYLALCNWPSPARRQSTRTPTQRDHDEERSGAYR